MKNIQNNVSFYKRNCLRKKETSQITSMIDDNIHRLVQCLIQWLMHFLIIQFTIYMCR